MIDTASRREGRGVLVNSLHLPLSAFHDRSPLQANIASGHSVRRAFALENATRPIWQSYPQRQTTLIRDAIGDLPAIVELAAHHCPRPTPIRTSDGRTLL